MKLKKNSVYLLAVLILLFANIGELKAQASPGLPCGDPDIDCPIDAPIVLLVAAVLLLSVKKIADSKRTAMG